MYHGTFTAQAASDAAPERATVTAHFRARRALLLGFGGLAAGVGVAGSLAGYVVGRADGQAERQTTPRALAWARMMLDASADELFAWAGDLEKVTIEHPGAVELAPCFERLLDTFAAPGVQREDTDMVLACAIRSLDRLGQRDALWRRRSAILNNESLPEARGTLEATLAKHGVGGR